jgi:threonine/homoserine/homoserine lactone efflux protein
MISALLLLTVVALAWSSGANDNFQRVALLISPFVAVGLTWLAYLALGRLRRVAGLEEESEEIRFSEGGEGSRLEVQKWL